MNKAAESVTSEAVKCGIMTGDFNAQSHRKRIFPQDETNLHSSDGIPNAKGTSMEDLTTDVHSAEEDHKDNAKQSRDIPYTPPRARIPGREAYAQLRYSNPGLTWALVSVEGKLLCSSHPWHIAWNSKLWFQLTRRNYYRKEFSS